MNWTGLQLSEATGGVLRSGGERVCTGISTDTRSIREGDLFVPLRGAHFDGHAFIAEALSQGCCGCLVEAGVDLDGGSASEQVFIEVVSTLTALGDLASTHLRALDTTVVGITGSNGKTTTKDMVATILKSFGPVASTHGNYNNLIGLPLTALQVMPTDKFAVFEMGMNVPGEIERLAKIAQPKVGLITSIAAAHLAGMGSVDAIRDEKTALYRSLGPDGTAVVNAMDPQVLQAAQETQAMLLTVGVAGTDICLEGIRRIGVGALGASLHCRGKVYPLRLRGLGIHNLWNAAMAVGVAVALDLDPEKAVAALADYKGPKGRLAWVPVPNGPNVIDDTYNANPESTRSALRTLVDLGDAGTTVAVLGDMLELGDSASVLHQEVGQYAADIGVDVLLAQGQFAADTVSGFGPGGAVVPGHEEAASFVSRTVSSGEWVLVKGSRGMRMERVIEALKSSSNTGGA